MSTLSASPSARQHLPPVHGHCKWLGRFSEVLLDRGACLLEITTSKGVTRTYSVQRLAEGQMVQGYRLSRMDTGEIHDVDVSFGTDPRHWSCSCPDYCWKASRRPVGHAGCKHIKALAAALRRVGL